jgi:hypothetical protein
MRNDVSRLKYLAFVLGLGACFFDPQAVGPGNKANPQLVDGGAAGTDGTAGTTEAGKGGAGDGSSGTGAVSGTSASGTGGMSTGTSGVGGMSGTGVTNPPPPPPPLLVNGETCTDDARCMSGHCDGICCDKGAECCKTIADCSVQPSGLGMSCDDRATCRGSAGQITCTAEFKCVTMNGVRNDTACSNRIEANDCGPYLSVFCLGGEMQSGAPDCATTCADDTQCDLDAHCDGGKCIPDLANGEPCKKGTDCTQGSCRNIKNGVGVCCGALADCCKTPVDCPDMYRQAATCNTTNCSGMEFVAECNGNICNSHQIANDAVCAGMKGPTCGLFNDIICMPGRNNQCKNSCTVMGDCDATAYCDAGRCVAKRGIGGDCNNANQCTSGNCGNGVCCSANGECCKNAAQCTMRLDHKCDQAGEAQVCQGSRKEATCMNSLCSYAPGRIGDDRSCTTGGSKCNNFKDVMCDGSLDQKQCATTCSTDNDCDTGLKCLFNENGVAMGCGTPTPPPSGAAGASGSPAGTSGG